MTPERAKAGLQPLFHEIIGGKIMQPPSRSATPYDKEQFLRMWLDVMPGSQGNTSLRRQFEKPLLVLMGVVGLVLLIACANLASLLTARAAARQREIAIRLAIGSSRAPCCNNCSRESVLLSSVGGLAALHAIAVLMVKGLLAFLPTVVTGYAISSSPDWRMLAFTFGLSLFTGVAFGLVPAVQSTNPNIAPTLKDPAGGVIGGAHATFRKALVAAQVMLSLLLLIGAGPVPRAASPTCTRSIPASGPPTWFSSPSIRSASGTTQSAPRPSTGASTKTCAASPEFAAPALPRSEVLSGNEWDNWVTIDTYQRKGEPPDPRT